MIMQIEQKNIVAKLFIKKLFCKHTVKEYTVILYLITFSALYNLLFFSAYIFEFIYWALSNYNDSNMTSEE